MRKKLRFLAFLVLAGSVALLAKSWLVKVIRADIRSKPDYLSSAVLQVKRGDSVEMVQEGVKGWLLVTSKGQRGYLHQSALEGTTASLIGKLSGPKEASSDEVALAAKGFNEEVEKKVRGEKGYNFNDLDWVMKQGVEIAKVKKFMEEGRLK